MGYRCHVWKRSADGETELPLCSIEHKTVDSALNCRHLKKGTEAAHRWEIRGGAFVVEKGEGPQGWARCGQVQGGISWEYSRDYIRDTERVTVAVDGDVMIDLKRPMNSPKKQVDWSDDFALGMAYMLATIGKHRKRSKTWIERVTDAFAADDGEGELPANVVKGPWK
jgi:hypothetical protein